jgi:hypothetical protein
VSIEAEWVSVTSAAAATVASGGANGVRVSVYNAGPQTAFLGGSDVASGSASRQLGSAQSMDFYVEQGETLYAKTASGTAVLQTLRGGVNQ